MQDSIFTKIIKGEIPAHKIYEDEKVIAFLDIKPVQPGHTLVVPKAQVGKFYELPDEDLIALFRAVKKVAAHLEKVLGKRTTVQIEGFDLGDHAHIKLIPADTGEEFRAMPKDADPDELATMAKKLQLKSAA
jgi:histidine triad (HIT) family protein